MNRIFKRSLAGVVAVAVALLVGAPQVAAVPDRVDSTVTTQAAMANKLATSTAATVELGSYGIANTWILRNGNSGKCLTVRGDNNDAPAVQYTCTSLNDQVWEITSIPGMDGFRIQNRNSGKCLLGRGYANYTPVVQYTCAKFADQMWYLQVTNGLNIFRIKNVNSGKCILVQGHGQDAPAVQYTCANYPDQYWF